MGRLWQTFIAPGDGPLPGCPETWCVDRVVSIPLEHWELMLELAQGIDADATRVLRSYALPHNGGRQSNGHPR